MSERLTADELDNYATATRPGAIVAIWPTKLAAMASELKERRAQDLTAEEREALEHAREFVAEDRLGHCDEVGCVNSVCIRNDAALAVLDKLLTREVR